MAWVVVVVACVVVVASVVAVVACVVVVCCSVVVVSPEIVDGGVVGGAVVGAGVVGGAVVGAGVVGAFGTAVLTGGWVEPGVAVVLELEGIGAGVSSIVSKRSTDVGAGSTSVVELTGVAAPCSSNARASGSGAVLGTFAATSSDSFDAVVATAIDAVSPR